MTITKKGKGVEKKKRHNPLRQLQFQAKNYQIPHVEHMGVNFTLTPEDAERGQLMAAKLQEIIERLFLDEKINPAMENTVLCTAGLKTDYLPIELEQSFETLLKTIWLLRKILSARGLETNEQREETLLLLEDAFYFYGLFTQMAMSSQCPSLKILTNYLSRYSESPRLIGGLFSLRRKVLDYLERHRDKAIVLLTCNEGRNLSSLLTHTGTFFEFLFRKDIDFLIELFVGNSHLMEYILPRRSGMVEYLLNHPHTIEVLTELDSETLDSLFQHNDDVICEFIRFQRKELEEFFNPKRRRTFKRVLSHSSDEILRYLRMLHDNNIQHLKVDLHKMLLELESIREKERQTMTDLGDSMVFPMN